tara:strand:+ start:3821 stop:4798 length:978 start_codon:yes stop_codon:yes gene_type:complete
MEFLVTGATGFIGKRVIKQLLLKDIKVVATDINVQTEKTSFFEYLKKYNLDTNKINLIELDISSKENINSIFDNNNITHMICCGYQMSNMIDSDPVKGSKINIVGMTNLFETVVNYNIKRMIFPSSESVYGNSQTIYGNKAVHEDDYCGLQHQSFTYAVMKLLNEFMAQKFIKKHNVSIACTRPSVVFGFGRKRSSLMWAEDFATLPAIGKPVSLPFPKDNKDNFIYVDDCAEQMVLLALKDKLNYFAYNTGSETVSGVQLAEIIKELVPNAEITFEPNANYTPFIDEQNDERIRKEISFIPRSLKEGIKAHMNEAREYNNLKAL